MCISDEILYDARVLKQAPYLRGLDFDQAAIAKNPLLHVKLFHGQLCNMKCPYCFTQAPSVVDGYTCIKLKKLDQYSNYVTNYKEKLDTLQRIRKLFGTQTVVINGKGEPTLEPEFKKLIKGLHSSGFTPVVFTNGTTFKRNWKVLYENNASVVLKMNSTDPAKSAGFFGIGQNTKAFDQIRLALDPNSESFKAFAAENRLGINCILSRKTVSPDAAPSVLRFCRENGAIPWLNRVIITGRAGKDWNLSDRQYVNTLEELLKIDRDYGYKHEICPGMNFATPAEIESYFLQITDHGRMFFSDGDGLVDNCNKLISHKCTNCWGKTGCIENNIDVKLLEHYYNMLTQSMR